MITTIRIRAEKLPHGWQNDDGTERDLWTASVDMFEDGNKFSRSCNAGGTKFHRGNAIASSVGFFRSLRRHRWSLEENERVERTKRGRWYARDLRRATTPLERYRVYEGALTLLRHSCPVGDVDESTLIHEMATVWWELTEAERDMLDAEGPRTFPAEPQIFPDPSR